MTKFVNLQSPEGMKYSFNLDQIAAVVQTETVTGYGYERRKVIKIVLSNGLHYDVTGAIEDVVKNLNDAGN